MLNKLEIDDFSDGFDEFIVNCRDIPIAFAAGYFSKINYFIYLFYRSIIFNWSNMSWSSTYNYILKKLGLNLKKYKVDDYYEFISFVKNSIDKGCPILIPIKYNSIFLYSNYKDTEDDMEFFLPITAYDAEKDIYHIRVSPHVIDLGGLRKVTNNTGLYKVQVNGNILKDMWESSNREFNTEESHYANCVYKMEKTEEVIIDDYDKMISDLLLNFSYKNNNAILYINKALNKDILKQRLPQIFIYIRNSFSNTHIVIFKVLEIIYRNILNDDFYQFKKKYLDTRNILISRLHKSSIKEENLENITDIGEEILKMDQSLFNLIEGLYTLKNSAIHKSKVVKRKNLAYLCMVTADSEETPCRRVVNGKSGNFESDAWLSDTNRPYHWLIVDLGKNSYVAGFIIKHMNEFIFNTREYYILGSTDKTNWINLVQEVDNELGTTTHDITICLFRYIKLYITYPSLIDNRARIQEFIVLGKD